MKLFLLAFESPAYVATSSSARFSVGLSRGAFNDDGLPRNRSSGAPLFSAANVCAPCWRNPTSDRRPRKIVLGLKRCLSVRFSTAACRTSHAHISRVAQHSAATMAHGTWCACGGFGSGRAPAPLRSPSRSPSQITHHYYPAILHEPANSPPSDPPP